MLALKLSSQVLVSLSDFTTRTLDSLFILAKLTLKVQDPQTHIATHNILSKATTILTNINPSGVPLGNYLRCLSGAYYNFAGSLYQAGRHGPAVPFLKDACTIGGKALARRSREKGEHEEKAREQEGWKQLEETLFRRWELLGICHMKIGDRKVCYPELEISVSPDDNHPRTLTSHSYNPWWPSLTPFMTSPESPTKRLRFQSLRLLRPAINLSNSQPLSIALHTSV